MTAWPSVYVSTTVQGSPIAAAAETVIGTVQVTTDASAVVALTGMANITIGTSGTAVTLRLRADSLTGTIIATSGLVTAVAAAIQPFAIFGSPAAAEIAARTFVLTAQVQAGAANSTIGTMMLLALTQF
jgi:hypothetical protein